MLLNYIRIAYRNLIKHKGYSALNIIGLAIGLTACFFIFQYVHFQKSFESFNPNAKLVYRLLLTTTNQTGESARTPTTQPAIAPAMKRDFSEVEDYARLVPSRLFTRSLTITRSNNNEAPIIFEEPHAFFADPAVFHIFSFPVIAGNAATALAAPRTVAISESISKKYFGSENPIGKTVLMNGSLPLTVTAVFKEIPQNSHVRFNILLSFPSGAAFAKENWTWPEFYTYIRLVPGADPLALQKKLPAFADQYMTEDLKQYNLRSRIYLQTLPEIHLQSNYEHELEGNGSISQVNLLSIIGLFILLIGFVNYINLSTARGFERAAEVGIRKVVGASKKQLIFQFLTEALLTYSMSIVLAVLLILLLTPMYRQLVGIEELPSLFNAALLRSLKFWVTMAIIFIGGVACIGAYPALLFARLNPVRVLKGRLMQTGKGVLVRKGLVLFQFVLSLLLIAGSLVIFRQLNFMRSQSLGYNSEQLLICKAPASLGRPIQNPFEMFREAMQNNPTILSSTSTSDIPGETIVYNNALRKAGTASQQSSDSYQTEIDGQFLQTFQIHLAAGRGLDATDQLSKELIKEKRANILINEKLLHNLGFASAESAINQKLIVSFSVDEFAATIVGVVKNYHQRSLQQPFDPILYYYPEQADAKYFVLRIQTKNLASTMDFVEKGYKKIFAGSPFTFFFLNDFFDTQYHDDRRFGYLFGIFTGLAIFVSCLGLLGLASFTVNMRLKEIGIRKVLGATVTNILMMMYQSFFKIVLLSAVVAMPLMYFGAVRWLENYAFHIRLGIGFFFIPAACLLIVTAITVAVQSIGSARSNPVDILRS